MENEDKKIIVVTDILGFLASHIYDVEKFSKYVYAKGLDDDVYSYKDKNLDEIFDLLGGMSASEEFHYTKKEVLKMLAFYLLNLGAN